MSDAPFARNQEVQALEHLSKETAQIASLLSEFATKFGTINASMKECNQVLSNWNDVGRLVGMAAAPGQAPSDGDADGRLELVALDAKYDLSC